MVSKLAGIVETVTIFFEQLFESGYLTLDYIFYVGLALQLVLIVFFLIKSSYSYELRLDRSLDGLNRWLYYNQYLDETNLIDFNNRVKRAPKLLRYHWQQYMLYREKEPSHYMSTYNLIEKPIKTSSFSSNIKNLSAICYTLAATTFVLNFATFTSLSQANFAVVLLNSLLTPLAILLFNTFFIILLRSWQNSNLAGLYQNFHLFSRYIDKSSVSLPEYIDFEVLFTKDEIKRGIPVLNEFLEKRARQEQKELEEAMRNTVDHEEYDFSHLGLSGSQIIDRAMKEAEIYLNQRQRTLAEIRQLESEIESAKRNYENNQKEYERKMQASKENIERLRKQQEESTNRIESNYIRKQQTDEIKKQEQLEKDYEGITLRYNQDVNTLSSEISARRVEIEEKRQLVERAMEAEYKTFSGKVYKELKTEAELREQEEKEKLLAEKDNYADLLQHANVQIVEKDTEIKRLNEIIQSSQINRAEHGEFYNEELTKEQKQRHKKLKPQNAAEAVVKKDLSAKEEEISTPVTEEVAQTTSPQYDEFGGYYDDKGYYRYQNGTYYDPEGNFHDEFGGHYDKEGTYFPPTETKQTSQAQTEEIAQPQAQQENTEEIAYDEFGGYYDEQGYYRYQNGSYYDPEGIFHDEFGGYYDKDGNYFPAQTQQEPVVENLEPVIEKAEVAKEEKHEDIVAEEKQEDIVTEEKQEETPVPAKEEPKDDEDDLPVVFEEIELPEIESSPEPKQKAKQEEEKPAPRKRGRPRKVVSPEEETKAEEKPAPRKRGRPRKVADPETENKTEEKPAPRKRGRPRKVALPEEETKAEEKPKTKEEAKQETPAKEEKPKTSVAKPAAKKQTAAKKTTGAKRGRPKKETSDAESKPRAKRGKALKKRTTPKTEEETEETVDPLKALAEQIQLENENLKLQHEELKKQIDSTLSEIDTIPADNDEDNKTN